MILRGIFKMEEILMCIGFTSLGILIGMFLGTLLNSRVEKYQKELYDLDIEYLQSQIDFHEKISKAAAEQFCFLKKKVGLKKK